MGVVERIFGKWNAARTAAGKEPQESFRGDYARPEETDAARQALQTDTPAPAEKPEKTESGTAAPAITYPKPEAMSREDYDFLKGQGYSAEGIAAAYRPYDPASGGYLQRMYEMSVQKPALDEKAAQRRRQAAYLGDTLRLLGEMFAAGKGAHIRARGPEEFMFKQEESRQRALEDRYLRDLQAWQEGLADAARGDYDAGFKSYEQNRKAVRDALADKRELAYKTSESGRKQANENRNFELRQQAAGDSRRHREVTERQGWSRLALLGTARSGSGKSGKPAQIVYRAVPGDPEAVTDPQTGEKIRTRTLPYGLDYIVGMALSDEALLNEHPEWRVYTAKKTGAAKGTPEPMNLFGSSSKPSAPVTPTEAMKRRIAEAYFIRADTRAYGSGGAVARPPANSPGREELMRTDFSLRPSGDSPRPPGIPVPYRAADDGSWQAAEKELDEAFINENWIDEDATTEVHNNTLVR